MTIAQKRLDDALFVMSTLKLFYNFKYNYNLQNTAFKSKEKVFAHASPNDHPHYLIEIFDESNKFWIMIAGVGFNRYGIYNAVQSIFLDTLFNTIRSASGANCGIMKMIHEFHPYLMKTVKEQNITSINFGGHSLGGIEIPILALIYQLLIDFYQNHDTCTDSECKNKNTAQCKMLQSFVSEFYAHQYKYGFLAMWNSNDDFSEYMRNMHKNYTYDEFNYYLLNVSPRDVIYGMMQYDKAILQNMKIENILIFGAPSTFSEDWNKIYNQYFYDENSLENSKHLSFQNVDDIICGFAQDGTYYGAGNLILSWITSLFTTIEKRYCPGCIVKVQNIANLQGIQVHYNYLPNLKLENTECLPNGTICTSDDTLASIKMLYSAGFHYLAIFLICLALFNIFIGLFYPFFIFSRGSSFKEHLSLHKSIISAVVWIWILIIFQAFVISLINLLIHPWKWIYKISVIFIRRLNG